MASHPPGPCCYNSGVQHEGTALHADGEIAGKPAYISPASGPNIHPDSGIIYLSDIGGIWHNSRLLADQFAASGYLTVCANYNGKVRQEGKEISDTIQTHSGSATNAQKYISATLTYLKSHGCTKIGAVGYCAGAPHVLSLLTPSSSSVYGETGVLAGYIAHPAGSPERMVERIGRPLSIAAADEDSMFTAERRRKTEEILREVGVRWQISLYSDVRHGFAVRRAAETRAEVYAKRQAFLQAVGWFEEFLVGAEG